MTTVDLDLKYSDKQIELFFPETSFPKYSICNKGRRGGLTKGAANAFIEYGIVDNLWFLPSGPISILWLDTVQGNITKYFERYFYPELLKLDRTQWNWRQQEKILNIGRVTIDFKSAEIPENIEGFGYHIIFLNEAGIILEDEYLFNNAVLPMLIDFPNAKLIAAGTPKGRVTKNGIHKYYQLYLKAIQNDADYRVITFTGRDNPFISQKDLEEVAANLDDVTRRQEIDGEFVHVTDKKFLYAFKEEKHVIEDYTPNPHLPILCSWDFNVEPMTCLIGQATDIFTLYAFDEIRINSGSTPEVCEQIKIKYNKWLMYGSVQITGDATGRNRSALTVGNLNHYRIIMDELEIAENDILVRKQNMGLKDSRVLCNSVLQNAKFYITKNCKNTINDIHAGSVDDAGDLIKTQKIGLHHFDACRYLITAAYPNFISHPEYYED